MPRNPQVHFRLKPLPEEEKKDKDATTLIYLQFLYNKRRLFFSFGQKVKLKNWNASTQRVKNKKETTADGQHSVNDLLDNLKAVCEKAYKTELKNGIPSPEKLKKYLLEFLNQNKETPSSGPKFFDLFDRFIKGEIKHKGKNKSKNTLQNYQTLKLHLLEYQAVNNVQITFEGITLDFFYRFVSYLKTRDKSDQPIKAAFPEMKKRKIVSLGNNTIAKDINILKTIMAEAVDLKYTSNLEFKHKKFSVDEEDTDSVFLSEKEILHLYKHDFSKSARLEAVRDLFVVGCFTGLRYSDYSNIKPQNIITNDGDLFIKMITQKTGELVIIPCSPIVLEVFDKYQINDNKLPRSLSPQKFNDYLKEACQAAGLTEQGRLSTEPKKELWQCVSSHTARRSMATNLYLQGFPTIDIMKITGHRTERAFLKYIRVSKLDTAKRLSEHMKKNWASRILKVAS